MLKCHQCLKYFSKILLNWPKNFHWQEENILESERCAASFWSKGIEVQQVLDESMKSFKAFFRWLSVEIRRISDLCLVIYSLLSKRAILLDQSWTRWDIGIIFTYHFELCCKLLKSLLVFSCSYYNFEALKGFQCRYPELVLWHFSRYSRYSPVFWSVNNKRLPSFPI